jgi:hypothetical protein
MNGLLGNAVLKVCLHATKGELLSRIVACLLEGAVVELPVATVVVQFLGPVFCSVMFKGKLGGHCFLG